MFSFNDLKAILRWSYLDTVCRYRRSILGPFWEVVNVFVLSAGIALIFGTIFGSGQSSDAFLYVLCGVTFWQILSAFFVDSPSIYADRASIVRSTTFPKRNLVLGKLCTLLITNAHILPFVFLYIWVTGGIGVTNYLLFVFNFFVISFIGYMVMRLFATLGALFGDIHMIIRNFIQVSFFVTPVFWRIDLVPDDRLFILDFNPFWHLLSLLRNPLMGQSISAFSYFFIIAMYISLYALVNICIKAFDKKVAELV